MLSIIIITRNTRELVAGLLASIEADRLLKAALREVIVVDNGSTDGTEAMVASRFPHVSYVRQSGKQGVCSRSKCWFAAVLRRVCPVSQFGYAPDRGRDDQAAGPHAAGWVDRHCRAAACLRRREAAAFICPHTEPRIGAFARRLCLRSFPAGSGQRAKD